MSGRQARARRAQSKDLGSYVDRVLSEQSVMQTPQENIAGVLTMFERITGAGLLPHGGAKKLLVGTPSIHPVFVVGRCSVIASLDERDGEVWYHVSVGRDGGTKLPEYSDLVQVRDEMFQPDAVVVQVWPPKSEHYTFCEVLHLWQRVTPAGRLVPDLRATMPSGAASL